MNRLALIALVLASGACDPTAMDVPLVLDAGEKIDVKPAEPCDKPDADLVVDATPPADSKPEPVADAEPQPEPKPDAEPQPDAKPWYEEWDWATPLCGEGYILQDALCTCVAWTHAHPVSECPNSTIWVQSTCPEGFEKFANSCRKPKSEE